MSVDKLDTSAARSEILKRIRTLQKRPDSFKPAETARAHQYLGQHPRGPQPTPAPDVVERFVERSLKMLCTVSRVNSMSEVPAAAANYLSELQLSSPASIWPSLSSLDWSGLGMTFRFGACLPDDLIGISGCAYAVAETGTLVFCSQPDQPSNTHLLPETHLAVVRIKQIFMTMEDVFDQMRGEGRSMPRALNFVSGPSRTADIEQTIVLGAHGPYRVHLILVDEA